MGARGPYAKGTAKREEILAVALEVVAEHGSRRAYVNEIARRAGLTQTGLMHHFRSREELFEAVIQARDDRDRITFTESARGIEGFLAIIEHNQQVPGLVQLYVEFAGEASHPEHPSHGFFRERYAYLRGALTRDIAFARSEGTMGEGADASAIADMLIACADGLQVQWLMGRDIDMAGQLRALWESLCAASHHTR